MVLNTKKREIARLRNALSHSGLHLDDAEDPCEATTAAIHSGNRAGGNKKRRKDDDLSTVATEDIPVSPMAAPSSSITTPNSIAADSTRSAAPNSAIAVSKAAAPTRALSKKQQIEMMKQNLQANRNKQLLQSVAPVVAIDVKISPIKEAVNEKDSDDDNRGDECKYDESVCSVDQREDNRSISTDDTSFDNRRVRNHSSAVNHSISDRIVDHPLSTTISSQPEPSSSQVKNNVGSNRITSRVLAEDDSDSDN
jgi:hypothetical protein